MAAHLVGAGGEPRAAGEVVHGDAVHRLRARADRHLRQEAPGPGPRALAHAELHAQLDDLVPALVGPGGLDIEDEDAVVAQVDARRRRRLGDRERHRVQRRPDDRRAALRQRGNRRRVRPALSRASLALALADGRRCDLGEHEDRLGRCRWTARAHEGHHRGPV
jgi:hypothetical protein